MKRFGILFALSIFAGFAFVSCVTEDDDSDDIGSIVGKWNYGRSKISIGGHVVSDEPYEDDEPSCERDYFDIREDGTAEYGEYYLDPECTLTTNQITFVRGGNNIIVGEGENSEIAEVMSASTSTMVLRFTDNYEGVTSTTDVSYTKAQ